MNEPIAKASDVIQHIGVLRRSGRYPWGSGRNPYQRSGDFLSRVSALRKEGKSSAEIAKFLGITTRDLRLQESLASAERRQDLVATAKGLRAKGMTPTQIAKEMGYTSESSVRSLFNEESERRMMEAGATAAFLKAQIDEKGMIDVSSGVERELGISKERLNEALYLLEAEGYPTYSGRFDQVTNPGKKTTQKVIGPPGTEHKDIYNLSEVNSLHEYSSRDGGKTFSTFEYPTSLDSKRLQVLYGEEGGAERDGLIEIRRGVDDFSLGKSSYAQVRILVDGNKYIKGMAVYVDDLPDGVDIRFNTNKKSTVPKLETLKNISADPDNPFGSLIKATGQYVYTDSDGKEKLGLINKRAEEGDWAEWKDKLPSQFLAKQNLSLAKQQLKLSTDSAEQELESIKSLTNPTVKKRLLLAYADGADADAMHLKAASLPRQKYQVLIPVSSLNDNEVFAPNYRSGETVALVRYPHGGTFEIPILKVNNNNSDAKSILGISPKDAIAINSKVAERLSGADFDGDTVMVIPTGGKVKISSKPTLKGLEGFDPKMEYGGKTAGTFKPMKNTQNEMGKISNLITDMTLKGATESELARAVKHSMVVIDAEKHGLDYKQSEEHNQIAALRRKYQTEVDTKTGEVKGGASTLLSRAKSPTRVDKTQGAPIIDKDTGKVSYKIADDLTYVNIKGETVKRTQPSYKMLDTDDAYTLISKENTSMERAYADYANTMKSLANEARKEYVNTGNITYNPSAAKEYAEEVKSLKSSLSIAEINAPRERAAQRLANTNVETKVQAAKSSGTDLKKADIKKLQQQELVKARAETGAKRQPISISDKEWAAIQAGAITENHLSKILSNTDLDVVRERATPKNTPTMSVAKINKMANMRDIGYNASEIADAMGVSASTINKYLKEFDGG